MRHQLLMYQGAAVCQIICLFSLLNCVPKERARFSKKHANMQKKTYPIKPWKTSPECTQAGIYAKYVMYQNYPISYESLMYFKLFWVWNFKFLCTWIVYIFSNLESTMKQGQANKDLCAQLNFPSPQAQSMASFSILHDVFISLIKIAITFVLVSSN